MNIGWEFNAHLACKVAASVVSVALLLGTPNVGYTQTVGSAEQLADVAMSRWPDACGMSQASDTNMFLTGISAFWYETANRAYF